MPLLIHRIESSDQLFALTHACLVKGGRAGREAIVQRDLSFEDGRIAGELNAKSIAFNRESKVDCQSLIDIVPPSSLPPGDYVFTVALGAEAAPTVQPQAARFSVTGRAETKPARPLSGSAAGETPALPPIDH